MLLGPVLTLLQITNNVQTGDYDTFTQCDFAFHLAVCHRNFQDRECGRSENVKKTWEHKPLTIEVTSTDHCCSQADKPDRR